jgi:hypothetical protein
MAVSEIERYEHQKDINFPGVMLHVYNLSYSGGRGRRIRSSRPA